MAEGLLVCGNSSAPVAAPPTRCSVQKAVESAATRLGYSSVKPKQLQAVVSFVLGKYKY